MSYDGERRGEGSKNKPIFYTLSAIVNGFVLLGRVDKSKMLER